MNDSMAQPREALPRLELSGWKTALSWTGAVLIALLFLVSGLWKITDPAEAAVRMAQARIPEKLSLAAAIGFGIAETFAAVLILVPRFRKWGSWLTSLLLISFLIYVGLNYQALRGEECSCFPWLKRSVGPGFFIGDLVMLLLAVAAGVWAKPAESLRSAFLILGAVTVFALVSYGVAAARQTGVKAPPSLTVDGQRISTREGKIFIYYFDPECMHCNDAARRMSKYNWGDTRLIGVATAQPQFAQDFLRATGFKAGISTDLDLLRKTFQFTGTPAGTAIENGRQKAAITMFEHDEPGAALKKLGFVY